MTIAVSEPCDDMTQIGRSYAEASAAARHGMAGRDGGVLHYSEIGSADYGYAWRGDKELKELSGKLWQGDFSAVKRLIEQSLSNVAGMPMFIIRLMCFEIINSILRTLSEMQFDLHKVGIDYRAFSSLTEFASTEEFMAKAGAFLNVVCAQVAAGKESGNSGLKDDIQSFIDTHFDDPNLLLESIGDQLGMSYSYLSRYFKDQTGINISEYLAHLRIEKVKTLVEAGERDIGKMAASVGYANLPSFNRMFKKQERMTLKQYVLQRQSEQTK
jgi:YesN/AraC family two-component response regulator